MLVLIYSMLGVVMLMLTIPLMLKLLECDHFKISPQVYLYVSLDIFLGCYFLFLAYREYKTHSSPTKHDILLITFITFLLFLTNEHLTDFAGYSKCLGDIEDVLDTLKLFNLLFIVSSISVQVYRF